MPTDRTALLVTCLVIVGLPFLLRVIGECGHYLDRRLKGHATWERLRK